MREIRKIKNMLTKEELVEVLEKSKDILEIIQDIKYPQQLLLLRVLKNLIVHEYVLKGSFR